MIFVEEIIKLTSVARAVLSDNPQAGKLSVAPQSLPAHDERADDRFAHAWQIGQGPTNGRRGHLEYLGFVGFASGACQRGCAHEHGDVADEIARAGGSQDLFLTVARFEDLQAATQDNGQSEIALAGFEERLAAA